MSLKERARLLLLLLLLLLLPVLEYRALPGNFSFVVSRR